MLLDLLSFLLILVSHFSAIYSTKFQDQILKLHNHYRNVHGSPGLRLDGSLSKKAQSRAEKAAAKGKFIKPNPGENSYMMCTSYQRNVPARDPVEAWYDEVCNPDMSFDKPNNPNTRAFTQLVWKDTSFIGVGKATQKKKKDSDICTFIVVLYKPPGNLQIEGLPDMKNSEFKENVQKGNFKDSYCDKLKDQKRSFTKSKLHHKRSLLKPNRDKQRYRKSFLYKYPSKLFVDPETGQNKGFSIVSPYSSYIRPGMGTIESDGMYPSYSYNQAFNQPYGDLYREGDDIGNNIVSYSSMNADRYTTPLENNYISIVDPHASFKAAGTQTKTPEKEAPLVEETNDTSKRTYADDISLMLAKALKVQNALRAIHEAPKLKMVQELNDEAEKQAQSNADLDKLKHAANLKERDEEENLAFNCKESGISNIEDSIKDWYTEICDAEDPYTNGWENDTQHFSKMVWKGTTEVGCGRSVTNRTIQGRPLTCTFFACRYRNAGNKAGHYAVNLLKGTFDKELTCNNLQNIIDQAVDTVERPSGDAMKNTSETYQGTPQQDNTQMPGQSSPAGNPTDVTNAMNPPSGQPGSEQANPPSSLPGSEQTNSSQPGSEQANLPSSQPGLEQTNSSQPGSEQTNLPSSQPGYADSANGAESQQDQDEKNYEDDATKVMNKFRELHGTPALSEDETLHKKAKGRADNFVVGAAKRHHKRSPSGENVQVACNPVDKVVPPEDAVTNWYREVCSKSYNFDLEGPQGAPHFTQIIWKAAKSVGVAYATKKKKNGWLCTVIVAEFEPAGNTAGQYVDNVPKGQFDKSFCGSLNTIAAAALDEEGKFSPEGKPGGVAPLTEAKNEPQMEGKNPLETPLGEAKNPLEKPPGDGKIPLEKPPGEGKNPLETPLGEAKNPLEKPPTEGKFPLEKPTGEGKNPLEEPLGEAKNPLEKPPGEGKIPLEKPPGEGKKPLETTEEDMTPEIPEDEEKPGEQGKPPLEQGPFDEDEEDKGKKPLELPEGEGKNPLKKPVGEGKNPLEKPVGEGKNPLEKPFGEGKNPLEKPPGEGKNPLEKPFGEGKNPLEKPPGEGKNPLEKPFGEGKNPLEKPAGEGKTPLEKPFGEGKNPLELPEGEGENPLEKPSGEGKNPLEKPFGEGKNPLEKPPGEGKNPLEKPFGEGKNPLEKPPGEGKTPLEKPFGEGKNPLELPEGEGKNPLEKPSGEGKNPLEKPFGEGKNPLEKPPGEGKNPLEKPFGEGKNPLEKPAGEGKNPLEKPFGEGKNPLEKPPGEGKTPLEKPFGEGKNPLEKPPGEGKNPLEKPFGEGKNPLEKPAGEGKNPLEKPFGEGKNPLEKPPGEGKTPLEKPFGEGKNPLEKPPGEGKTPLEKPFGEGKNPLELPEGEGENPLEKPSSEGKNPLEKPPGEGKNPLEKPFGEGKNPLEKPAGEGKNPLEKPFGEGKNPLEKPPGEGKTPLEQPPGEGKNPLEKPFGEGKNPLEKPPGEGKNPLEKPFGEGKNPLEKPPGEGKNPLEKPFGEGKNPLEKPPGEGKNPLEKPPGEGKTPLEKPPGEGKNPLEEPFGEGKNPLEKPFGEGKNPLEKPPGEGKNPLEKPKAGKKPQDQITGSEEGEGPEEPPPVMSIVMKNGLIAHNALRGIHGSKPMKANLNLIRKARELAKSISDAGKSIPAKKQEILDVGENVDINCNVDGKLMNSEDAVLKWWAADFCDAGPSTISDQKMGSGTQVVWDASVQLGMASSAFHKDGKLCFVVVALYLPKGNDRRTYDQNVFEKDFDYNTMCEDKNNTLQVAKEIDEDKNKEVTGPPGVGNEKPGAAGGGVPPPLQPESGAGGAGETGGASGMNQQQFAEEALAAHNKLRKIHGTPPMTLDKTMSADAEAYATTLAKSGVLKHAEPTERKNDGENLAYTCQSNDPGYKGQEPTARWYNEVCEYEYDFNTNDMNSQTLHFTQVVWKKTTKLGMGYAKGTKDGMTCYYAVGRYREAGNMMGDFKTSVPKGSFDKRTTCPNLGKTLSVDLSKRTFISTHKGHGLVSNSFKKLQLKNTRDDYRLKGLLKKKGFIQGIKKKYKRNNKG